MVDMCNDLAQLSISAPMVAYGGQYSDSGEEEYLLVAKTMHLARALVNHHQLESHEDAVDVACEHILAVDVGT